MENDNVKFKIIFSIIICVGFFSAVESVLAVPDVSSVSGTVSHGQNITVSGAGFGVRNSATPLKYDDFESGTDGGWLTGWETISVDACPYGGSCHPTYSNAKIMPHSSMSESSKFEGFCNNHPTTNCLVDIDCPVGDTCLAVVQSQFVVTAPSTFEEAYFDAWYYIDSPSPSVRNAKYFRVVSYDYNHSGSYPSNLYQLNMGSGNAGTLNQDGVATVGVCNADNGRITGLPTVEQIANKWTHVQFRGKLNTPGVVDGTAQFWIDGAKYENIGSFCTRGNADDTHGWENFGFGKEWYHDQVGNTPAVIYWDNVYADTTFSRAMLCNNSNFDSATVCEPQIPSAWSDGSLTAEVNLGALPDTGTAYIFVFDSNNDHNAIGYPVTLGGESDTTPPASPTGLAVN